jgi:creatinine amidohydrolase
VSSSRLADLAWPEVGERVAHGAILAVPVGSTEQHGPHLPLSVDTDLALALCNRLAATRLDVLVAPALAYGSSGEHSGFPGTLSIGQDAVELLLLELGRSAADTFGHVLFVSAHGGNTEPVGRAVRRLRREGRDVCVFHPRWDAEPHAGLAETAMMLALTPDRVRMERAEPGDLRPLAETLPELRRGGVRAVSRNGVLGDPTSATAGEGADLLDRLSADLRATVAAWHDPVPA